MHVAFVASEAVPFAKTGGLGDVIGALPRASKHAGHTACRFPPCISFHPRLRSAPFQHGYQPQYPGRHPESRRYRPREHAAWFRASRFT